MRLNSEIFCTSTFVATKENNGKRLLAKKYTLIAWGTSSSSSAKARSLTSQSFGACVCSFSGCSYLLTNYVLEQIFPRCFNNRDSIPASLRMDFCKTTHMTQGFHDRVCLRSWSIYQIKRSFTTKLYTSNHKSENTLHISNYFQNSFLPKMLLAMLKLSI